MNWNISAEVIGAILVIIIIINSKIGYLLPTFRNIVFQGLLYTSLCSILSNVLSALCLSHFHQVPYIINYALLIVYFISTALIGMLYFIYTMSNIFDENKTYLFKYTKLAFIPMIIFTFIIISNPFTNIIFSLDFIDGYQQGVWVYSAFVLFYLYVIASLIIVIINRSFIDQNISKILTFFPFVSGAAIFIQYLYPTYLISGIVIAFVLLLIYLYIQHKERFIDPLTNLLNRQQFTKVVNTKQQNGETFIVIVISLKDFKIINDTYGFKVGDHLLISICDYLKTIFLSSSLYRYSGDEFAIILKDKTQLDEPIKQLMKRLSQPWYALKQSYYLNYSISSIAYPSVAQSSEDIVKGLEYALVAAKEGKGNRYLPCTTQMLLEIKRKYLILQRLRDCCDHNCFDVVFQPIFDVKKQAFNHAEALVRLPQKEKEYISPCEFIPIAEEAGFIANITYCVLHKVCQFIQEAIKQKIAIEGVTINFSSVLFKQDNLQEKVLEIIKAYDIPCHTIKIEITESVLISNFEIVNAFINSMKKEGIHFLLDDFGTGYSNFSSVLMIPFHTIKFDRSLIRNTISHKATEVFFTSLITSFKKLHFNVLAEGIEHDEELALAIRNQCDYIQGFYYSKPLDKTSALQFMKQ